MNSSITTEVSTQTKHELRPVTDLQIPTNANVTILAPHPDDFDAIGVTLRQLANSGCKLSLGVLTTGANGVKTGFDNANTKKQKAELRKNEQLSSCDFFGIQREQITFFTLEKNAEDALEMSENNTRTLRNYLESTEPDLIFLPHGNDSNMTHQRVYALYKRVLRKLEKPHKALLNSDVKTRKMNHQIYTAFDEETAKWKSELLKFHKSQQQRNIEQRGHGLDQRILDLNKALAIEYRLPDTYTETFELEEHAGRID